MALASLSTTATTALKTLKRGKVFSIRLLCDFINDAQLPAYPNYELELFSCGSNRSEADRSTSNFLILHFADRDNLFIVFSRGFLVF